MNEGIKSIFMSKTFWGFFIAAVASAASTYGHPIGATDQASLVNDAVALAGVIGSVWGIYGRIVAKHTLTVTGK